MNIQNLVFRASKNVLKIIQEMSLKISKRYNSKYTHFFCLDRACNFRVQLDLI